jgi:hypothetical protein
VSHKDLENYDEFMKSDAFHEIEVTAWQIALFARYGNSS